MRRIWQAALIGLGAMVLSGTAGAQIGDDMADFWEDMGGYANVSGPSSADLQRGGYYTLGQVYIRTPRRTLDPINLQLPSYRAGCGSIDVFAGGFSHIDADEFIEFLKAVAADSAGLIFKAGIDAVSPELGGILDDLENAARDINAWSMDSCEAAESALGGLSDLANGRSDMLCRLAGTASGKYEDAAEARDRCGIDADRAATIAGGGPEFEAQQPVNVNLIWSALEAARLTTNTEYAEFLMSLVGAEVIIETGAELRTVAAPSIAVTGDLIHTVMDGGALQMLQCDETTRCLEPALADVTIAPDTAFRGRTVRLLESITQKVRTQTALSDEELDFINLMPLPIYRMLVVHTQYNPASGNPLAGYADVIAGALALEYLARGAEALGSAIEAETRFTPEDKARFETRIQALTATLAARRAIAAEETLAWVQMMEQTRALEQIIAARLEGQVLASLRFSSDVQVR